MNSEETNGKLMALQGRDGDGMGKFNQLLKGRHTSCDVLKSISYATINALYPEQELLRIYTNGPHVDQRINSGTEGFCNLLSVYAPVGYFTSAYDGEVKALLIA
ncbi:hypothetical protein CEXT_252041 [Caerostris extrusa]|uniref:Uncharacterized protein n=1 Tax=Caerostris extrusa TaxID=172846 RepID=A0AAV4TKR6_CAEEX|nr:hypothetical protein CEXT_252041 [Caerostris extrusa]